MQISYQRRSSFHFSSETDYEMIIYFGYFSTPPRDPPGSGEGH